jgi:sugar diacid utilization regulator
LVTIYHRLSAVALQTAEVGAITELLASQVGVAAFVFTDSLDVIAASVPPGADAEATARSEELRTLPSAVRLLRAVGRTRRAVRSPNPPGGGWIVVAPIVVGTEVAAFLVTLDQRDDAADEAMSLLVTEHAATMCGIVMGRDRAVIASASRVREELLEGLLFAQSPDDAELERWAHHLGYHRSRRYRVVSISCRLEDPATGKPSRDPAERRYRLFVVVDHFFASRAPGAITGIRPDEVVVVVPEHEDGDDLGVIRLSKDCLTYVRQLFPDAVVTVGIGAVCDQARGVARSYREARRTIDAADRLGRHGGIISFESLGIHRLLLQVPDLDQLRSFAQEVLGSVVDYERCHQGELLKTLSCFFHDNGSPQRTAQRLHVHPNTVTYRLRRIEEIASLSLDSHPDRLLAAVALEILNVLNGDFDG